MTHSAAAPPASTPPAMNPTIDSVRARDHESWIHLHASVGAVVLQSVIWALLNGSFGSGPR